MWRRALAVVGLALAVVLLPQTVWAATTEPTTEPTATATAEPTATSTQEPSPSSSSPTSSPTGEASSSTEPVLVEFSGEDWQWVQALVVGCGLTLLVSMAALVGSWGGRHV